MILCADFNPFNWLIDAKAGGAGAAKSASRYGGMATDEALKILNMGKADIYIKDTAKLIAVGTYVIFILPITSMVHVILIYA